MFATACCGLFSYKGCEPSKTRRQNPFICHIAYTEINRTWGVLIIYSQETTAYFPSGSIGEQSPRNGIWPFRVQALKLRIDAERRRVVPRRMNKQSIRCRRGHRCARIIGQNNSRVSFHKTSSFISLRRAEVLTADGYCPIQSLSVNEIG